MFYISFFIGLLIGYALAILTICLVADGMWREKAQTRENRIEAQEASLRFWENRRRTEKCAARDVKA